MDDAKAFGNNDFPTASSAKEVPEVMEEFNQSESSSKDGNAWFHLKTITTFTSETSIQKSRNNHHYHSNRKHSESCLKNAHKPEEKGCQESFNEMKTPMRSLSNLEVKGHDSSLKTSVKKESTQLKNVSVSTRGELLKCTRRRRRLRKRSQSSSLSEGYLPRSETASHFSSRLNRSGTISDGAGDHTSDSWGSIPPAPVQSLTRFSPTSLLVESLIDQLCKLMEKDSGRQKKLYHVICERLHQMQLIDDTYTIEEFQFMRSHYQRALYQLLAVAKSSTQSSGGRSILLPLPSSNVNVDIKLYSEQVLEWSRYRHEYQELEYIAKGGFGHVYKVRNKLDGGQYAIKKIFLRYRYVEGFLRSLKEVKMLARLNHPNIVSYKAAWLEPLDDDAKKSRIRKSSRSSTLGEASVAILSVNSNSRLPLPPAPSNQTEDSIDIVFQETSPDTNSKSGNEKSPKSSPSTDSNDDKSSELLKSRTRLLSDLLGTSVLLQPSSDSSTDLSFQPRDMSGGESEDSGSLEEAAVCPTNAHCDQGKQSYNDSSPTSTFLRNWATLYVQMQLCERTLRQWLDIRNKTLPAYPLAPNSNEGTLALNLFRKIVRGVDYIHSQGIVHHDIKPSNIFVNADFKEVQVGDFGLSCCLLSKVDRTGVVGEHHGEVGTRMYAAPEQLRGKCNAKSDIYSLGIVLLELLQPFHTDMERSKVIQKLRTGQIPPELSTQWPHAARLMSDLLVTSPASRPTASELLQRVESLLRADLESDLSVQLASKDETIRLLKEAVASRDQEIAELREKLSVLERQSI